MTIKFNSENELYIKSKTLSISPIATEYSWALLNKRFDKVDMSKKQISYQSKSNITAINYQISKCIKSVLNLNDEDIYKINKEYENHFINNYFNSNTESFWRMRVKKDSILNLKGQDISQ